MTAAAQNPMPRNPERPGRYFVTYSSGEPLLYPYYWFDGEHWSCPESEPLPEPTGDLREMWFDMHPEWLWSEAPYVH